MRPHYFASPAVWRAWLARNHGTCDEIWVGFHKRAAGKPSLTWPEAVDQALCYGWIDGVRKRVDAGRYTIRFTPRRPGSNWSAVNIKRVAGLRKQGLMRAAGLRAFETRDPARTYSYEQRRTATLGPAYEELFRAEPRAWEFFKAQAPWYRRTLSWWVISAKQEATRLRRLGVLIARSAEGRGVPPLIPKKPAR